MKNKKPKTNPLTELPLIIYVWKESDGDGGFFYSVTEKLDELGDAAEFVGKYEYKQGGSVDRSVKVWGMEEEG